MRGAMPDTVEKITRRKMSFSRCPLSYCRQIFRSQRLSEHMKSKHKGMDPETKKQLPRQVLLVCTKHDPRRYLNVNIATLKERKDFSKKHGACTEKQAEGKLSKEDIQFYDTIFEQEFEGKAPYFNVDIDANSPVTPPMDPPQTSSASNAMDAGIGTPQPLTPFLDSPEIRMPFEDETVPQYMAPTQDVLEMAALESQIRPDDWKLMQDMDKDISHYLSASLGAPPNFTQELEKYEPEISFNDPDTTLEEENRLRTLLNASLTMPSRVEEQYREIYMPGMNSMINQSAQIEGVAPQAHEQFAQTSAREQSMQTPTIEARDQPMPTDDIEHQEGPQGTQGIAQPEENVSQLGKSIEHIQTINNVKNTMLYQLLNDNILLLEAQIASKKKALHEMERLFNMATEAPPPYQDNSIQFMTNMISLKDELINQLLNDNTTRLPSVRNILKMLQQIK